MPVADPIRHAENVRLNQRRQLSETQDVRYQFEVELKSGPINPGRRDACQHDLLAFCKTYGGSAFTLPWSDQHRAVAELIQESVTSGDMTAFAMPRGSGKSTISRWGVKWSVFYGHSHYTTLLGASERSAQNQLKAIKTVLRSNELLWEDFPDVLACLRHIDGQPRRCEGQKYNGEPTYIEWTQNAIVIPIVNQSDELEWAVIDVTGVTGEVRGRFRQLGSGKILRPDMAIVDDPQTRKSAKSATMVKERVDILSGDIKYMAGPDRPLGIVMPCTVIEADDAADQLLDRKVHPEWHGSRTRFFEQMPDDLGWWLDEYAPVLQELERADMPLDKATELYVSNREVADAGFEPSWPERYHADYGEVSAVQHGMNAYIRGKLYFLAEYQNQPDDGIDEEAKRPEAHFIADKQAGFARGQCPDDVSTITAFVDVSETVLWWVVCGFSQRFDGYVLDYGAYPHQKRRYYGKKDVRPTLQDAAPKGAGTEGAILWGLNELMTELLQKMYRQPDGTQMPITRVSADSAYGQYQTTVFSACENHKHSARIIASRGYGTKAPGSHSGKLQPGEVRGDNWRIAKTAKERKTCLFIHANHWKEFTDNRWLTHPGDRGCLQVYGDGREDHRMFADQQVAEYRERRSIGEYFYWHYENPPHQPDNHFWDCVVNCHVLASVHGIAVTDTPQKRQKRQRRYGVLNKGM